MTSRRFPANLKLDIRPSRLLYAYLLVGHGAVLITLLMSNAATGYVIAGALLLIFSAVYHLLSAIRQTGPYPLRGLAYREGQWFVQTGKGEQSARLEASWVLAGAVGLEFKAESSVRLLLFSDSCDREGFRRLRQILRFARPVSRVKNRIERLR